MVSTRRNNCAGTINLPFRRRQFLLSGGRFACRSSTLTGVSSVTTSTLPPADALAAALLDVQAVAQLLDCSTRHVYRLADAGRMPPPVRLGALVRWRRADLDAWLADGCPVVRKVGR